VALWNWLLAVLAAEEAQPLMASLLGRPMKQFGLENEHNKRGLEGLQTVPSPGTRSEEQKRDLKPSLNP
jgi:hypothetical protein